MVVDLLEWWFGQTLPNAEWSVVRSMLIGKSRKEIAKELGVTQKQIRKIRARAQKRVERRINILQEIVLKGIEEK